MPLDKVCKPIYIGSAGAANFPKNGMKAISGRLTKLVDRQNAPLPLGPERPQKKTKYSDEGNNREEKSGDTSVYVGFLTNQQVIQAIFVFTCCHLGLLVLYGQTKARRLGQRKSNATI